jgi:hypothetical protein
MNATTESARQILAISPTRINFNPFSIATYGNPNTETDGLLDSIRAQGILVPLVVVRDGDGWQVLSGHRRLSCARLLALSEVPCEVRSIRGESARRLAVLDYNRQRRKNFSQLMREADALEVLLSQDAHRRRLANLKQNEFGAGPPERPNSDARATPGRTDAAIASTLGLGGKDLYRQARAIWRVSQTGDPRAVDGVAALDAGTKTIHSAYKDLRRRDRFTAGFRPTPYDVWSFKSDPSFGIAHPGSIPPAIVAHLVHYYTKPGDLVVDPMAGGGSTLDVCLSMGRNCLSYDLVPRRPEIAQHDITTGFPAESAGCSLVFCDPPYGTMMARRYGSPGVGDLPFTGWLEFLQRLARDAFGIIKPNGHIALLVANQTEKDLPAGFGYLDHAFYAYQALTAAGFLPERRISCPMSGAYLPQHVRRARVEGRMLGQVRDLLVLRKPAPQPTGSPPASS